MVVSMAFHLHYLNFWSAEECYSFWQGRRGKAGPFSALRIYYVCSSHGSFRSRCRLARTKRVVNCVRSLFVLGTEFSGNQTGISALGRQALLPAPENGRMLRLNISGPSARFLSRIPPSGHRILNAALHQTVLLRQPAESVKSCFLSGIRSSSYVDAYKLVQYRNLIPRFFHVRME